MPNKTLLIVAAFEPELAPIRALFEGRKNILFEALGIGAFEACASLTRRLGELKSKSGGSEFVVIFVGSVGCHDKKVGLLSVVNPSGVILCDAALANQQSYLPEKVTRRYAASEGLCKLISDRIPQSYYEDVATTLSITKDFGLAEKYLSDYRVRFENLELLGAAAACSVMSVQWSGLCLVTNHTGENAHKQWKENHLKAAAITAESLIQVVESNY